MFSVVADDLTTVTDAASAQAAWQAPIDLYDRETVTTTVNLLKNLQNAGSLMATPPRRA